MPPTREQLEKAAVEAETWLEGLDPGTTLAENPIDLRRIGMALRSLADDQREVDEAVAAARKNGRSWGEIGLVLGVSRRLGRPPENATVSPPPVPNALRSVPQPILGRDAFRIEDGRLRPAPGHSSRW